MSVAGPVKWNGPGVTIWSVFQNPVTNGDMSPFLHIQVCNDLNQCSCNHGFTGADCSSQVNMKGGCG